MHLSTISTLAVLPLLTSSAPSLHASQLLHPRSTRDVSSNAAATSSPANSSMASAPKPPGPWAVWHHPPSTTTTLMVDPTKVGLPSELQGPGPVETFGTHDSEPTIGLPSVLQGPGPVETVIPQHDTSGQGLPSELQGPGPVKVLDSDEPKLNDTGLPPELQGPGPVQLLGSDEPGVNDTGLPAELQGPGPVQPLRSKANESNVGLPAELQGPGPVQLGSEHPKADNDGLPIDIQGPGPVDPVEPAQNDSNRGLPHEFQGPGPVDLGSKHPRSKGGYPTGFPQITGRRVLPDSGTDTQQYNSSDEALGWELQGPGPVRTLIAQPSKTKTPEPSIQNGPSPVITPAPTNILNERIETSDASSRVWSIVVNNHTIYLGHGPVVFPQKTSPVTHASQATIGGSAGPNINAKNETSHVVGFIEVIVCGSETYMTDPDIVFHCEAGGKLVLAPTGSNSSRHNALEYNDHSEIHIIKRMRDHYGDDDPVHRLWYWFLNLWKLGFPSKSTTNTTQPTPPPSNHPARAIIDTFTSIPGTGGYLFDKDRIPHGLKVTPIPAVRRNGSPRPTATTPLKQFANVIIEPGEAPILKVVDGMELEPGTYVVHDTSVPEPTFDTITASGLSQRMIPTDTSTTHLAESELPSGIVTILESTSTRTSGLQGPETHATSTNMGSNEVNGPMEKMKRWMRRRKGHILVTSPEPSFGDHRNRKGSVNSMGNHRQEEYEHEIKIQHHGSRYRSKHGSKFGINCACNEAWNRIQAPPYWRSRPQQQCSDGNDESHDQESHRPHHRPHNQDENEHSHDRNRPHHPQQTIGTPHRQPTTKVMTTATATSTTGASSTKLSAGVSDKRNGFAALAIALVMAVLLIG